MKRIAKSGFFAPLLLAVFIAISLYAANAARLGWGQVVIPLLFSLFIAGLFSLIFWLNRWTGKSWPLVASCFTLAILLWYSITWIAGVLIMAVGLVVGVKWNTRKVSVILQVVLIPAILVSTIQGVVVHASNRVNTQQSVIAQVDEDYPNIYLIVPDRMPSIDAMEQSGIDTAEFVAELVSLGFYVKPDQLSGDLYTPTYEGEVHTTRTMRFCASLLNGGAGVPIDISYRDCRQMIKQPAIFDEMHAKGYAIYNVGPWWEETANLPTAGYNLKYEGGTMLDKIFQQELCVAYWKRTIFSGFNLRVYQSDALLGSVQRGWHTWQAEQVVEIAEVGEQTFTICHLLLPHEPFAWTADGQPQENFNLSQPELYYEQVEYAMVYLVDLVNGILQHDPGAVVIIQSDEGECYPKPPELNYGLTNTQWNGVLSAWRIPGMSEYELQNVNYTGILSVGIDYATKD